MNILNVSNIRKSFGYSLLFDHISFQVNDGDHLAIIGENGTGKSTILKMIIGKEEISLSEVGEKGTIVIAKNRRVGYLSQDVISSIDNTLYEEAALVFQEVINLEKEIGIISKAVANDPDNGDLIDQLGRKMSSFEAQNGYDYHYKIDTMLHKFNFSDEDFSRPISTFSGGERTKLAFAKLLLNEPDLLILDEPTNHLDVSTIDWLENYLKSYHGAILFVSHDRYFINNVANRIIELEEGSIEEYSGNFDYYLHEKQLRFDLKKRQYEIQRREIEKMERFIAFYKPKPRFVSRAKDREKKLARIQRIDAPKEKVNHLNFNFEGEGRDNKKILEFIDADFGYDKPLVSNVSGLLFGQDKLAIMGDNGVGKTTILKTILQNIRPLHGRIREFGQLRIGYLQQNDFALASEEDLLTYLTDQFPTLGEKDGRNHLGKFGFYGDDVFKKISVLSGGEKMRLILSIIVLRKYDLLLLDEPTNHLDLMSRESLIEAMQNFDAAIIFVSHDRYFIDMVANRILYIRRDGYSFFDGSYQEFKPQEEKIVEAQAKKTMPAIEKKSTNITPNNNRINKKRIPIIENRLREIEKAEYQEENYMDHQKMAVLEKEKTELETEYLSLLSALEEEN
jgi:ATP-binding cassette subfamily F protein 3